MLNHAINTKLSMLNIMLFRAKFEIVRKHIVDDIVEVVSLDELLSLVAWVHGHPAKLILLLFSLHEVPHRLPHHGNWLHAWEQ